MKRVSGLAIAGAMCLILTGCNKVERINTYHIEIGSHSAVTPVPPPAWWLPRHEAIVKRVGEGNVDLIFIGDSITYGWEGAGKETWDKYYAHRNAVNMGFSGDGTQQVLWRLNNGEITDISPKLVVIMIGTNNRYNSPKEISDGIIAICQKIRQDLPKTKILVLSIFPCDPNTSSPNRLKLAEASLIASGIADNRWIYYLNINDSFLDKDGNLSPTIMPDYLHPNAKGYQIWAEAIEPTVKNLMK